MSKEIMKIPQMPVTEIMSIAKAFAESGMFPDTKQAAQAIVKIQAGQELGIPPFAAMTGIHIIQGRPTVGAGLIASKIKGSGKYDYKIKEMTDTNCSIDFYEGKDLIGNSSFNLNDAKKAGTKNLDKFPKNMLFARAISNGAKWFTPDVFNGPVYTPEDMDTEQPPVRTEDVKAEVTTVTKKEDAPPPVVEQKPEEEKTPIVIPGHWYAKLEKCKTVPEVAQLYEKHKETVDANPELKELFKQTRNSLKQTA